MAAIVSALVAAALLFYLVALTLPVFCRRLRVSDTYFLGSTEIADAEDAAPNGIYYATSKTHGPTAGRLWVAKVSQNCQVFSAVANCYQSRSFITLSRAFASLTTPVDRDLEDQAIRDSREQMSPHWLGWLRRIAFKRLIRIRNTTIPIMEAPLLDYMLTMLLVFNKSNVGGDDVSTVERNSVKAVAFLSSFIRALFGKAEKNAQDRIT
ncbi:hypothetical protein BDM02DRAFT_3128337 [Thelephora ganbajun]|uniref:Uncharacterized protein n=1 Tax=Thelephora ganbajun TaxID=370292 RepID=A0ACB6ZK26_THEGA|nr:hypothetical protein BDM02DRAFT_3128337 [Thelephora ganbajun]